MKKSTKPILLWLRVNYFSIIIDLLGWIGFSISSAIVLNGQIGWDSPTDTYSYLQIVQIQQPISLSSAYEAVYSTSEFYGILIQQLGEVLHWFLRGNNTFLDPFSANTYIWQGLVTVAIWALSGLALKKTVKVIFGSKLVASIAWGFYMTLPVLVGLSAIDYKDSPLASGLTLLSCGLALSFRSLTERNYSWYSIIFLVLGCSISLGARPGAWPILLAISAGSVLVFITLSLISKKYSIQKLWWSIASIFVAYASSLLLLFVSNPMFRIGKFRWLADSFFVMQKFPWIGDVRVAGETLSALALPKWYVPAWIFAQLPILTFACVLMAFTTLIWFVINSISHKQLNLTLLAFIPFVIQGILIPIAISLNESVLYNAIRHMLFIYPVISLFCAAGFYFLLVRWKFSKGIELLTGLFTISTILFSLFACLRWFPYTYAYVNPVSNLDKSSIDWELDYWGLSSKDAMERLAELGYELRALESAGPWTDQIFGVNQPFVEDFNVGSNQAIYSFYPWKSDIFPNNCQHLFSIERDGLQLGNAFACTPK